MANDFTTKTLDPALLERLNRASSAAEIGEICKQSGERAGVLVRERDGSVFVHEDFVVPQAAAPLSPYATANFSTIFYVGNSRFELVADTAEQLEEQERRILQLFGR